MNFKEIMEKYEENYFNIKKLDELLDSSSDFDSWLSNMRTRALKLQEFYSIDNQLLDEICNYSKEEILNEEEAKALEEGIDKLYDDYVMDASFLYPILLKLIHYYEEKNNIEKLIELYYVAFYLLNESERRSANLDADLTYQYKILALKDHYQELPLISRRKFFLVYYNLSSVCLGMNSTVTPEESIKWYKEARDFFYSDLVQSIDKDTDRIVELFETIEYDWIAVIDRANELSSEGREEVFKVIDKLYKEELLNGNEFEMDSFVFSSNLEKERLLNHITLEECINRYLEYYRYNLNTFDGEYNQENYYTFMESPIAIERWLSQSLDNSFRRKVFNEINEAFMSKYKHYFGVVPTPFIYSVLAEWCECSIKYLVDSKEKEEAIFNLIVKNQIPTYLHSVMVMKLSKKLFEVAYKENKSLFDNIPLEYDDLREFVKKSALLHDIGKVKITNVINKQGRRLSDMEFKGISLHPEFGIDLVKDDPDLRKYMDIILYHHKWYDGTKGYPKGDMNTKSPYRIIIDIVSIADCMDAATDDLGRNYKSSKDVLTVIEEFISDSGTRYNPDLVKILSESKELIKEFTIITKEKRAHYMYEAYMEARALIKE
ncbi:HD domain-containing protein [Anaeroplasma bactoclasticum]|jgi:HD-GYP domain-containing protein (c-di-GMP phosphodiesterase class II)|uniref:HD domain-containing protein n=1 Tax=Anaeroplasma bactoclasticum TaxID=2088 RepID=A0A397RNL8_9MOLU|nr:HD domain-containing protein [Anaeroplasma bactoclasticum]RIA75723.1 HD domain-containing protein [Anaeroplasma bactoclasticum]